MALMIVSNRRIENDNKGKSSGEKDDGHLCHADSNVQKVRHFNNPLKATLVPSKFPSSFDGGG